MKNNMRIATIEIFVPAPEQLEHYSTDDLVILNAQYGLLAGRIAEDGYDVPQNLTDALKVLKREIDHKKVVDRELKLESLKARRAAMATTEEKRQNLDREIADLEGKSQTATG